MKDFQGAPGRLRSLPVAAKLLYTAFVLATCVGLWVSHRLYGNITADHSAREYYAGQSSPPVTRASRVNNSQQPTVPDDGPSLELPTELVHPQPLIEQISERKLLEVTHFHLFSIPVYLLILAHLWLLVRMRALFHLLGVGSGIFFSGLHMAAPWILRSAPNQVWLMPLSGTCMLVTMLVLAIVPTVDMWLPRR